MIEIDVPLNPVYKGVWQLDVPILGKTISSLLFLNAPELDSVSGDVNFKGIMEDELGRASCDGTLSPSRNRITLTKRYMTYLGMPLDSLLTNRNLIHDGAMNANRCENGTLIVGRHRGSFILEPFDASSTVDRYLYQQLVHQNDLRRKNDWHPL